MQSDADSGAGQGPRTLGRYCLCDAIASGGMATVHLGRLVGAAGFSRIVAIKRMHQHLATDPSFVAMFIDEARLAARVRHPNVVQTLDVASVDDELFVVLEYVHGVSLSHLMRIADGAEVDVPLGVAIRIVCDALQGLHAAHEAKNERGDPIHLVHRDVSPHNILVGTDGVARVLDFGIAKALGRLQVSADGELKGKAAYIAPEQLRAGLIDRRTDIYAASVVLWEVLTGNRLFDGQNEASILAAVLDNKIPSVRASRSEVTPELDAIILRGANKDPAHRFATAAEMADALEHAAIPASTRDVAAWVTRVAARILDKRAGLVARIESNSLGQGSGDRDATPTAPTGPRYSTGARSRMAVSSEILTDPAIGSRRAALWGVLGGFLGAALLVGAFLLRGGKSPAAAAPAETQPARAAEAPAPAETRAEPAVTLAPPVASESPSAAAAAPRGTASVASSASAAPKRPAAKAPTQAAPKTERPDDLFGRN